MRATRIRRQLVVAAVAASLLTPAAASRGAQAAAAGRLDGTLHTSGTDTRIYTATNQPVRLLGFNWPGTPTGGRTDALKAKDDCGNVWRTPADRLPGLTFNYDNVYQVVHDWGYNTIRIPVSWNNLEPVAPVWNAATGQDVHSWSAAYLNDLRSMVTKAQAAGLWVVLDLHQDFWSPALHHIVKWNGQQGLCEGVGMPRWLDPSIDAKPSATQQVDFYNAMNWFYRNVPDPASTLTHATPWQLFQSAWSELSYVFSARSGFPAYRAVVGADLLNEPYAKYVGGSPPAGQTVLQAAGSRLAAFYTAAAPAVTTDNPGWLLFFEDSTGGYNAASPAGRETPVLTGRPGGDANWVYSMHDYDFGYGTFSDGVTRHDDFGITLMNVDLANAQAWQVPLYVGEFTNFELGIPAWNLTTADMAQTAAFLSWAKQHAVSWTFWAYANTYPPMNVIDYRSNHAIPAVKSTLAAGR